MDPFRYNVAASLGPFRIIDAGIRRWLWAHSGMSTLLLRWAHSGSSTLLLGGGYGPIQLYRHCCFGGPFRIIDAGIRRGYEPIRVYRHCCLGGPIQDYRRRYSALAMGPFSYIDIAASVGPFGIIDAGIRRWLWAHSGMSTLLLRWAHSGLSMPVFGVGYGPIQVYQHCCFGGPTQDYRHRYSVMAMGPFRITDIVILANFLANLARRIWASGV
jgi:hypothetical protein